jgi:dipeptidyl aminopeptidase/acylaminoacyl peptidase
VTNDTTSSDSDPTTPGPTAGAPSDARIDAAADVNTAAPTPFHDLDAYIGLRRVGGIALSPDGTRLVAVVSELDPKKTRYVSALWDIDPTGARPARRITRSAPGEAAPAFLPDGSVVFTSKRPDAAADGPDGADSADGAKPALWLLPAAGGDARQIARWDGGIGGSFVAADSGAIAVTATTFLGTATAEQDAAKRKERKDRKVAAILHDGYPVRYWDHDLGPEQPRLYLLEPEGGSGPGADGSGAAASEEPTYRLRDLTPDAGRALAEAGVQVSRDGSFLVAGWARVDDHVEMHEDVVRVDLPSGTRTTLATAGSASYYGGAISPDGSTVAVVREEDTTTDAPGRVSLWLVDAADGGHPRELPLVGDLGPHDLVWSPDGSTLYFAADENGRGPVFALDVASGSRRRLAVDGAYTSLRVHPDGRSLFAVRASYTDPGTVVALDVSLDDQQPRELVGPAARPDLPGRLTEVTATAADGTALRAWLALPDGASAADPAPLLLWVHGGPVSSWNSWSWRWCPWLMVAQGYAVLLPDPALSTGYGLSMIQRGWGRWGDEPFTDLMAITDAALERDDLDATRTAAMGGSFGGYMANWIAGHTDRFAAIVTHASLWNLDQFGSTTDAPNFWRREMTPERAATNSPSSALTDIRTPMLVIHGDKDYRVPIGEGLRLWWDLLSSQAPGTEVPHRFLYFPDENHWILTPQHAAVWYGTVLAFLAHHVLGQDIPMPEVL